MERKRIAVKSKLRGNSGVLVLTTLLFAVGVLLFFIKGITLPYKVAYPVAILAIAIFWSRQKMLVPIGLAFVLSAAGDIAGAIPLFILQILFFALAHGAYIWYFLRRAPLASRVFSGAVPGLLLLFLFVCIVPHISVPVERIGVGIYGLIIAVMLYIVLQYRGVYAWGFRCAALLFVFSDSVIAWSRFVTPVPGRTYVVMITYYLAQYLFFLFAIKKSLVVSRKN